MGFQEREAVPRNLKTFFRALALAVTFGAADTAFYYFGLGACLPCSVQPGVILGILALVAFPLMARSQPFREWYRTSRANPKGWWLRAMLFPVVGGAIYGTVIGLLRYRSVLGVLRVGFGWAALLALGAVLVAWFTRAELEA
jgi:hypothetical protein